MRAVEAMSSLSKCGLRTREKAYKFRVGKNRQFLARFHKRHDDTSRKNPNEIASRPCLLARQWAVTGHGIQAVNKKLEGKFDVEISRLWDDALVEQILSETWIDLEDFTEALEIARKRFSEKPINLRPHQTDEK